VLLCALGSSLRSLPAGLQEHRRIWCVLLCALGNLAVSCGFTGAYWCGIRTLLCPSENGRPFSSELQEHCVVGSAPSPLGNLAVSCGTTGALCCWCVLFGAADV